LNELDFVIAAIIVISTFIGYIKGFLRKVLGIAGIILGFVLAVKFYKPIGNYFAELFKFNPVFTYVICFLSIIILLYFLAVWLAKFFSSMNSGTAFIDKFLGIIFGFLEGLILASVLVVNLSYLDYPSAKTRESSVLYPKVYNVAPMIFDKVISLSPDLKTIYENYKKTFSSNE
jgi:membrane protein required for colicin V production